MIFRQLFDGDSSTYTYVLADSGTGRAMLIDPVLEQHERDLAVLHDLGLTLTYVLETHVHADHVTAAGVLSDRTGAKLLGSERGPACLDRRLRDGELVRLDSMEVRALSTPGHTDDSMSYVVGGFVFTGDALLIRACGRTDFQNGDPRELYRSITEKLWRLPDETLVYPAHDYKGLMVTTIGEEKRWNPRIAGKSADEFVAIMNALGLPPPRLIDIAVPANRLCGRGQPPASPAGVVQPH